jgi:DNA-binding MarR family transcriptional regulator
MPHARTEELLTRMARLIAADGYDHGLQPVQWQALRYLAAANRFSRTPGGLTAWLGQTKGSVSQTINALVRKDLVRRGGDDVDHRVVRLDLTEAGRKLVQDYRPVAADILDVFDEADRVAFSGLIEKALRASLAARGQRPFGLCRDCRHFEAGTGEMHRCQLLDVQLDDGHSQQICVEQDAA